MKRNHLHAQKKKIAFSIALNYVPTTEITEYEAKQIKPNEIVVAKYMTYSMRSLTSAQKSNIYVYSEITSLL